MRANRGYPDDSLASPISDSTSQKQPMINSVKPPVRFSPKQASFDTPLQGWAPLGLISSSRLAQVARRLLKRLDDRHVLAGHHRAQVDHQAVSLHSTNDGGVSSSKFRRHGVRAHPSWLDIHAPGFNLLRGHAAAAEKRVVEGRLG